MFNHQEKFASKKLRILYIIGFFLAVSTALLAYIKSSYIEGFIGLQYLGFAFVLVDLIALIAIIFFPQIIKRYGKFRTFFVLSLANIASLFFLAFSHFFWINLLVFIFFLITLWLIWIGYDIFLETYSQDFKTGRIRGFGYTIINFGWLISPFLAGFLLEHYGFSFIFLIVGFLMLAFILFFRFNFKNEPLESQASYNFLSLLKEVYFQKPIFRIFCASFLLNFFYSWMVIYTPLYLRNLGMSWPEIGFAFTIMLLPFILLQYPAGWLADKFLGEKEMLSIGFVIMGLSTLSLFFIKTSDVFTWAILLFTTRVGASLVEIMKETYFYKQIGQKNINFIFLFRNIDQLAYIISLSIAIFILQFFPLQFLFLFLGLFMFSGLGISLRLKDTK